MNGGPLCLKALAEQAGWGGYSRRLSSLVEQAVTLRIRDVPGMPASMQVQEAVADVTPRRLQSFRTEPDHDYVWEVLEADLKRVLHGPNSITADEFGLVTMKQVKINRNGVILVLKRVQ